MGAGLAPTEPVLLALSGGADSVYLLTALAKAEPRPRVLAVHVDHRLRGDESREDAAFCARTCAKLGIPFSSREVEVDPEGPNLEARAREARYKALALEARNAGLTTILTGHHEDDALETLLLRWMRGSALPGLAGLKARNILGRDSSTGDARSEQLTVVRPLLSMRREEVRRLLRDSGMDWREDSSNESPRFTRNRVRNELMPEIAETCGEGGFENLRAFASAVESLEEELAARTADGFNVEAYHEAVGAVLERVHGAYSVVGIINGHGLFAFRDPHGIKPIVMARRTNQDGSDAWCVASESVVPAASCASSTSSSSGLRKSARDTIPAISAP